MKKIISVLAALFILFSSCRQTEKEIKPEQKRLTETVYASGTLQPADEYKVTASVDGYLQRAFVKEGDTVQSGQALFQLYNENRSTGVQTAAALLQQSLPLSGKNAPNVLALQEQLSRLNAQVYKDSLDYCRYKNLEEQNAVAKSVYETHWLQYQNSQRQRDALHQQIREAKLTDALQWQQAKNSLAMAQAGTSVNQLKSFSNGYVFAVYNKPGDLIHPGAPVALIGSGAMLARLSVDEEDYSKIKPGQRVVVKMEAFPGKLFHAIVKKVYPVLNGAEQSFRVDAPFTDALPGKVYGLNLEANIVVDEGRSVLAVPKAALVHNDSLRIKEHGEKKLVKVEKGVEDNEWVEIRKGILSTTKIILP